MYLCHRCNLSFSLDGMSRDRKRVPVYCKGCKNTMTKNRLDLDRSYIRAYKSDWRKADRIMNPTKYRYQDIMKKIFKPEQISAHNKVSTDLRSPSSTLVRKPCEVCGDPNSQAHHDNYKEQLKVRWLCPVHHSQVHSKRKEIQ